MNNTGTHLTPDATEVITMVKERVDEGSIRVSCRGMDDQTRRLIEDKDVFVLE
jgi:hypothetical protein